VDVDGTNDEEETLNPRNEYDYFRQEIANRLVDRLDDILREEGFPLALDIGAGPGYLHKSISSQVDEWVDDDGDDGDDDDGSVKTVAIGGIQKLVMIDSSEGMLHRDDDLKEKDTSSNVVGTYKLIANEEGKLPFPDGTFDLVMSSIAMHWVNDLPSLLQEIKRVLKPDGCFLLAMVGGATLSELRSSLVLAELERDGGVSPHVGPFIDVSDVGTLLTNAGFALPTVDVDTIHLGYPNAMVLMEHLQRMGEGNASLSRKPSVPRDTFLSAACIYDDMFSLSNNQDEDMDTDTDIEASVQVIYAIGWSPHESQQKPKERGSASHKVGEVVIDHTNNKS
jgi:NADH dehydrogenase [ubiquinone] 1 alpha subcomplex assembly factor 5